MQTISSERRRSKAREVGSLIQQRLQQQKKKRNKKAKAKAQGKRDKVFGRAMQLVRVISSELHEEKVGLRKGETKREN